MVQIAGIPDRATNMIDPDFEQLAVTMGMKEFVVSTTTMILSEKGKEVVNTIKSNTNHIDDFL